MLPPDGQTMRMIFKRADHEQVILEQSPDGGTIVNLTNGPMSAVHYLIDDINYLVMVTLMHGFVQVR